MKTASKILLFTGLALFIATMSYAQNSADNSGKIPEAKKQTVQQSTFTDTNKNGVCDNYEARGKSGQGRNFTDSNGDGKCDNCGTGCKGNGNCCGKGKGNCKGTGKGNCDGKGPGNGQGCGNGHKHRHGCGNSGNTNTTPVK